jgi:hypothetical protein
VLLGHPGGPYFAGKDADRWTVLKGEVDAGEDLRSSPGASSRRRRGMSRGRVRRLNSVRSERHRPKSTQGEEKWAIYWEVTDLRRLADDEAFPVSDLSTEDDRRISPAFVPHGTVPDRWLTLSTRYSRQRTVCRGSRGRVTKSVCRVHGAESAARKGGTRPRTDFALGSRERRGVDRRPLSILRDTIRRLNWPHRRDEPDPSVFHRLPAGRAHDLPPLPRSCRRANASDLRMVSIVCSGASIGTKCPIPGSSDSS